MSRFRLSFAAESDLHEAWLFIADDSIEATDRLLGMILAKIEIVAAHREIGEPRLEFGAAGCRSTLAGSYVIFYRPVADFIEIVRIVQGARDLRGLS
jgi:toxin ParE1/3/4